jgi:uncharacterized protein YozE (UPF0346 family)
MGKLFTFGDSFTFNKKLDECEYAIGYRNDGDTYWTNIISEKLGLELHNFGYGSLSNDRILDSIIENIDLINTGDVVIVGKSFNNRFDIPNPYEFEKPDIIHNFKTISPHSIDILISEGFSKSEAESIIFYGHVYDDTAFIKRHDLRFKFIEKYLKNKKIYDVIFWEVGSMWNKYENIKTATNNKINDLHWSFEGHRKFADFIINEIENKKLIPKRKQFR